MTSPSRLKFPGEDFFHPGFTPSCFTPSAPSQEVDSSSLEPQPKQSIARKPVPHEGSQQFLSTGLRLNPLALNPVSITSAETATRTPIDFNNGSSKGGRPGEEALSGVPLQNTLSVTRAVGEVSAASSAYGDSSAVSANPSQPSPPAPWPASPHMKKGYASSQLHGGEPVQGPSQPVSPISEEDYFNCTQASRANSLAYRVSQRTLAPARATSDTPLPPLPRGQHMTSGQEQKAHGEHINAEESVGPVQGKRSPTNNWPFGLQLGTSSDNFSPVNGPPGSAGDTDQTTPPQITSPITTDPSFIAAPPASQLRALNTQQQIFGPQRASQQYQQTLSPHRSSQTFIPYRASHPQYAAPLASDTRLSASQSSQPPERLQINSQQPRYSTVTTSGTTPFLDQADNERLFDSYKEYDHKNMGNFAGAASTRTKSTGFNASWLPEILWILLSIACLGIIAVVLSQFDQESLPSLPLPITLNTLVAFLVTICHAALIFPVIQGLSQLKWNWFSKLDRSLADFQAFEDAKTGLIGALKLLIATKGHVLQIVIFIIMSLSLVTSAMTQMIIAYPTRLTTGSSIAQVFRAEVYPNSHDPIASISDLDRRQKQSIQYGIYNPAEVPIIPLPPMCRSKDCQAQKFSSLAVCATVEDISNQLQVSSGTSTDESPQGARSASLSNGASLIVSPNTYNINITSPYSVSSGIKSANASLAFSDQLNLVAAAISNTFVIYTKKTSSQASDTEFGALEVLFHFCVADYTVHANTDVQQQNPRFETQTEEKTLVLSADGEKYTVDRSSAAALTRNMASTFYGTFSTSIGSNVVRYTGIGDTFGSNMFGGSTQALPEANRLTAVRNMTQNVANSLTNTIRSRGILGPDAAVEQETYVSIQWGWFAFLVVQVVLAACFLGGVIVETMLLDVCVLKSSALAGMLAVSSKDRKLLESEGIGRVDEGHAMASAVKADGIRGRFVGGGGRDGWVLDLGVR